MLPSIMDIAIQHGLIMNERSAKSTKDVRFKCPFCQADSSKDKYYLSLNIKDNVFKCWFCGESGGVLKFIALLEDKSIEEVKQDLFHNGKKRTPRKLHPAERLTPSQLKAAGFIIKPGRKPSRRELDWIWSEWQTYVQNQKRLGYMYYLEAKTIEEITSVIHTYAERLNIKPNDLLLEFTQAKFAKRKPKWAISAEEFIKKAPALTSR